MLREFYTENYRNLMLKKKLILEKNNFFLGICASGKTNLCQAITDITRSIYKINFFSEEPIYFYYKFVVCQNIVEYEYKRMKDGRVFQVSVRCDSLGMEYNSEEIMDSPIMFIHRVITVLKESKKEYEVQLLTDLLIEINSIKILDTPLKFDYNAFLDLSGQVIFTTRRVKNLEKYCKDIHCCYYIEKGNIEQVLTFFQKDIRDMNVLCKLLDKLAP